MKKSIFILLLCLLSHLVSKATSFTWSTTAGSSSWTTQTNWSPNNMGYPGAGDDVTIGSSTTYYPKLIGSSASCQHLVFTNAGTTGQTRLEISSGGHLNIYGDLVNDYGNIHVFGTANKHPTLKFRQTTGSPSAVIIEGDIEVGKIEIIKTTGKTIEIDGNTTVAINDYMTILGCSLVVNTGSLLALNPDIENGLSAFIEYGKVIGQVWVTATVGRPLGTYENNICRYHFLGNPITDNQPHKQLDDTTGANIDFKFYNPVQDVDPSSVVELRGHVLYNGIHSFPVTTSIPIKNSDFRNDCAILPQYYYDDPGYYGNNYSSYYDQALACSHAVNDQTPYFQRWDETMQDPYHTGTGDDVNGKYGYIGFPHFATFAKGEGMLANFGPTLARRNNDTCRNAVSPCTGPGPDFGYIDWLGTVNDSTFTRAVTKTSNSEAEQDGWNLLGNPYPSPLYLSSLYIDNSSVLTSTFEVFHGTEGTDVNSGSSETIVIEPTIIEEEEVYVAGFNPVWIGQGFWCYASTSGNVEFNNNQRIPDFFTGENGPIQRQAKPTGEKPFQLKLAMKGAIMGSDETVIRLHRIYEIGVHPTHDGYKVMSPANAMYTRCEGYRMANNSLPVPTGKQEIPLEMVIKKSEPITLSARTFNLPTGCTAILEDRVAHKSVPITADFQYTFSATAGNTGERFSVVLNLDEALPKTSLVRFNPYMKDGRIQIKLMDAYAGPANFRVTDISGRVIQNGRTDLINNAAQLPSAGMPAGIYTVTLQPDGKTATTQKLMVGW